ncbi:MAG: hypothetical protein P8Y00_00180 [Deltaproteobacteria bacterium]
MKPSERYVFAEFVSEDEVALVVPTGARIDFDVQTVSNHRKDTAHIMLYNQKLESRAKIGRDAIEVNLYAGYIDPPPLLFHGIITDTPTYRDEAFTGWIVEVFAEDTKSSAQTEVITRSYDSGTLLTQVFKDLAAAGGLGSDVAAVTGRLTHPLPLTGPPAKMLRAATKLYGYRYQIKNGTAIVVGENDPISTVSIPVISGETGMKGVPTSRLERRKVKVTAVSRLNSNLRAGSLCSIETAATIGGRKAPIPPKGIYLIESADFVCDPNTFRVTVTGVPYET